MSRPVNVLARPGLSLAEVIEAGATRVSVGGSLTWTAIGAMIEAATRIGSDGDLSALGSEPPLDEWLGPEAP